MMHKFGSISKEGFIEVGKEVFANATIEIDFAAAVAVKNTVEKSEWVLSWTEEKYIRADSTESTVLHEAILLEDGKITFVRQYSRPDTN